MGRLDDILKGKRAVKRTRYPLVNVPSALTTPSEELTEARRADIAAAHATAETYPTHHELGLIVLLPGEYATVLERALAFAKERGEDKPDPDTSPLYNLGMQIYTIASASVDPDDPFKPNGEPNYYAGSSVEEAAKNIQECPHFSRDTLAFLSQQHERWCEHVNPQASKVDYLDVIEGAAKSEDFLEHIRPGIVFSCFHFLAERYLNSPEAKSLGIGPSTESTPDESKTSDGEA